MGDLLLRGIDDALRRELQERAKHNGRSLSEEAMSHLRRSLSTSGSGNQSAGEWLRDIMSNDGPSEATRAVIETSNVAGAADKPGTISAWDVLRPILRDDSDEFAKMMDEIEAERKKDFGRPAEVLE
jgi:plasmid stability protein